MEKLTKEEMFGHNASCLEKFKQTKSAQTPHDNCQARWWRDIDWGFQI